MRRHRELYAAGLAILIATLVYAYFSRSGVPGSSSAPGHWLGAAGMALMLATETLYSLRKRARRVHWGRLADWLSVHIFMGIFGPYLVLLHAAWHYQGIAGAAMLMTVGVVASGFVGRYIYSAIPRTADGAEPPATQLEGEIAALNGQMQTWLADQSARLREIAGRTLVGQPDPMAIRQDGSGGAAIIRPVITRGDRGRMRRELAGLAPEERKQAERFLKLLERRRRLDRQVAFLSRARSLLAIWHAVHVPMGLVLFTTATVHALAGLYFSTLGR